MSLAWYEFLQAPSLEGLKTLAAGTAYPPLSYLIVTPFYELFGRTPDVAVFSSGAIWLLILLFATYGLGREVYNRKAGLLAAVIVSLYPLIVAVERDFFLDLQLTALVTLALWLLLYNNNFDHRGRAVALGMALGVGTMTKWPFAFFLLAPFLVAFYEIGQRVGWTRKQLVNLGLCLVVGGSLAASQYLFNYLFLPKDLYNLNNIIEFVTGFSGAAGHPAWNTLDGLLFYPLALINHQVSFFFVAVFVASLPALLRGNVRSRWILILSILVPYILATLLPVKEQRITMPYLPVIAVISAIGVLYIRRESLRTVAILVVIGFGLLIWWANSWGISFLPSRLPLQTSWFEISFFDQHHVVSPRDYSLQPGDWKQLELMEVILVDAVTQEIALPTEVPLIANTPAYNPNTLNYISTLYDRKLQFLYIWSWTGDPLSLEKHTYTYLVWKHGKNIEIAGWDKEDIENAEKFLSENQEAFTLIYQAPLPDGSEILAYRRGADIEIGTQ